MTQGDESVRETERQQLVVEQCGAPCLRVTRNFSLKIPKQLVFTLMIILFIVLGTPRISNPDD